MRDPATRDAILLFVKDPVPGKVKTRLCPPLSDAEAADLYRCMTRDTLAGIRETGIPCFVCHHPPALEARFRQWLGREHPFLPQQGPDLGARMSHTFEEIFAAGYERAVLVGSDLPDLPPRFYQEALKALARRDAVLGPAEDGGYYLVGFRKASFAPSIFEGVPWGQTTVFEMTCALLRREGLGFDTLASWRDVDTPRDLEALVRRAGGETRRARHTLTFLRSLDSWAVLR